MKKYILFLTIILLSISVTYANEVLPNQKLTNPERWWWGKVKDIDNYIDHKVTEMTSSTANIEEITLSNDIKNTRINFWSICIALGSCIATIFVFFHQWGINNAIKNDNQKERFENKLFMFLNIYRKNIDNVNNILVSGIGSGRTSFNFIFYEIEMMLREFIKLKPKAKSGRFLSYDEIVSITMSFIVNGVTRNSNMDERDIIYHNKYEDILDEHEYKRLKQRYVYFREMDDEKLQKLLQDGEHTLILNFYKIQLVDKKIVPWFYGIRTNFMPYIKSVRSVIDYIKEECPNNDIKENLKYLESSLSEHELAVLYIFANSAENNNIGLDKNIIHQLVCSTNLPVLYRYDKWNDLKNQIHK